VGGAPTAHNNKKEATILNAPREFYTIGINDCKIFRILAYFKNHIGITRSCIFEIVLTDGVGR
jgi:hypothetical protein